MLQMIKHPRGTWWALAGVAVVGCHGVVLYYSSKHMAVSAAALAGITAIVIVKHLGLLGPIYAMLRKNRGRH